MLYLKTATRKLCRELKGLRKGTNIYEDRNIARKQCKGFQEIYDMNGKYYMPARHCQMHFYKYSLTTISEKAQSELEELMEARGDKDGSDNYIAVFIKMLQINMRRIEERINIIAQ